MSLRTIPATLRTMRLLALLALALAAVSAYATPAFRYRMFCAGSAVGVLLVLVVVLFRAHPAEVEAMPHERPAPESVTSASARSDARPTDSDQE